MYNIDLYPKDFSYNVAISYNPDYCYYYSYNPNYCYYYINI